MLEDDALWTGLFIISMWGFPWLWAQLPVFGSTEEELSKEDKDVKSQSMTSKRAQTLAQRFGVKYNAAAEELANVVSGNDNDDPPPPGPGTYISYVLDWPKVNQPMSEFRRYPPVAPFGNSARVQYEQQLMEPPIVEQDTRGMAVGFPRPEPLRYQNAPLVLQGSSLRVRERPTIGPQVQVISSTPQPKVLNHAPIKGNVARGGESIFLAFSMFNILAMWNKIAKITPAEPVVPHEDAGAAFDDMDDEDDDKDSKVKFGTGYVEKLIKAVAAISVIGSNIAGQDESGDKTRDMQNLLKTIAITTVGGKVAEKIGQLSVLAAEKLNIIEKIRGTESDPIKLEDPEAEQTTVEPEVNEVIQVIHRQMGYKTKEIYKNLPKIRASEVITLMRRYKIGQLTIKENPRELAIIIAALSTNFINKFPYKTLKRLELTTWRKSRAYLADMARALMGRRNVDARHLIRAVGIQLLKQAEKDAKNISFQQAVVIVYDPVNVTHLIRTNSRAILKRIMELITDSKVLTQTTARNNLLRISNYLGVKK